MNKLIKIKNIKKTGIQHSFSRFDLCSPISFHCKFFSSSSSSHRYNQQRNGSIQQPHKYKVRSYSDKASSNTIKNKGRENDDEKLEEKRLSKASLKRLFSLIVPEKKNILIAMACMGVSTAATIIIPSALGTIIDLASNPDPLMAQQNMRNITIGMSSLFILGSVATFFRSSLLQISGERIVANLRYRLFSTVLNKEIGFFDTNKTGDIINRLSTDTSIMSKSILENTAYGIRRVIEGIFGAGFLFYISPQLSIVMLSIVPPLSLLIVFYSKFIKKRTAEVLKRLSETTEIAEERLNGVKTIHSFSQIERESAGYGSKVNEVFEVAKKVAYGQATFYSIISFATNISLIAVIYKGSELIQQGIMTSGNLISFMMYLVYVGMSFSGSSVFISELFKGQGASVRVFELLDSKDVERKKGKGRILEDLKGEITFENVHFNYPSRPNSTIFNGINFRLNPGEKVSFVGQSGSGKTTIAQILLKLYEPNSGVVKIDGVDIAELDTDWLCNQVGYISQDIFLFSGTIRDNIAYARPDATMDEIIEAAKKANAHNFIMSFPDGYDTMIGNRGMLISGGQKQRLSIARAILKSPKILVLDEATSNLDVESEFLVQQALDKLMEGRTVILIAHRLSTIRNSHKIFVLQRGLLEEEGTHDELIERRGAYYDIINRSLL